MMEAELKKKIAGYWNDWSGQYDLQYAHGLRSAGEKEAWRRFLYQAVGRPPQKVLDVGAGTGFISLLLAEAGYQCKGLDISQGMLDQARLKAKTQGLTVEFGLGDAEALPEGDEIYDAVVNRHLLWTLPNPERAIAEWLRVLKPGGRLIIIDGNWFYNELSASIRRLAGQLLVALTERKNPWGRGSNYDASLRSKLPLMQAANARNLRQLISRSGLHDLQFQKLTEVERAERSVMPLKQKLLNPYRRIAYIGIKP
jgi:ubiquinone/menaquinone biosynthesis C-methylase UbiE